MDQGQPASLTYNKHLYKAKNYETAMADKHQDKKTRQHFPFQFQAL